MKDAAGAGLNESVRAQLDEVIRERPAPDIPELVKNVLIGSMQSGALTLGGQYREVRSESYARRLLHRDPSGYYTVVVMTWGPGQKTALHDHAGIWCVECVVDGDIQVAQYDLVSTTEDHFRFERRNCVVAGRGSAGCLIPPFEYHTLANAADTPSVTVHVYGGEMDHCHVFEPSGDGSYRRIRKELAYNE